MDSIKEQEKEKSILSASIRNQLIQNIGYRLLSVLLKRVDQKKRFLPAKNAGRNRFDGQSAY